MNASPTDSKRNLTISQGCGDFKRLVKMMRWLNLIVLLFTGCVLCPPYVASEASPTGVFRGVVVDSAGNPVSGANVRAVYARNWTPLLPPVPNHFVIASEKTDKNGHFELTTSKKISWIAARCGELSGSSRELLKPSGVSITLQSTQRK
jgi:hypothetical protein